MPSQRSLPTAKSQDSRPIHTLRHRSIKASIWRNLTARGPYYNVTISRGYRDKESGEWRDTQSIGYDDLMNVAALMYGAHSYISGMLTSEADLKKQTRGR